MIIRDETSSVEITLREVGARETPGSGDLRLDVAATTAATVVGGPFSGRNNTVWVERDAWARFLEELRELERTRGGEVHLRAMSPAEFQLTILATDRAGHLAAEGWVGRQYAGRTDAVHDRVCFRVEIDPGILLQLIHEFDALAPAG
jgi:hypothetical protein